MRQHAIDRRSFLATGACAVASVATAQEKSTDRKPTKFQVACMTLPYRDHPLERALTGLQAAGYKYVAWGTEHREGAGKPVPVMPSDAPPQRARELGKRCRDLGLEPLLMFGVPPPPEDVPALTQRIKQASAGGVGHILIFGSSRGSDPKVWVKNFKMLGPIARDHGVLIVVKQHGGNTGTGAGLAEIIREVADDGVKINYDAGNVMDYHKIDPLPDIAKCADEIRSFCIKDHRLTPKDQDCGPGFGEIDHYKLLAPVTWTGRPMPLCCENIFPPLLPRPTKAETIDALAQRARQFLETVVAGLQA